jgi:hypothetical protein
MFITVPGEREMKNNKRAVMAMLTSAILASSTVWASDVYIDQEGDDVQINITQTNGMNWVNTQSNPAIINGDEIRINFLQQGDQNTADINLRNGSDGTLLNYSAIGSLNEFTIDFSTAIDNEVTVNVEGDTNIISICGNLACTSSASVSDTVNVVNVDGNVNTIRFALNASNANNTLSIDGNTNTVDLTQSNGTGHITNIGIIGSGNAVTIVQGQ